MTIYVGNLSYNVPRDELTSELTEIFGEYGSVLRVSVPLDRETQRIRGFAFIEMADESAEDRAIADLDGAEWVGRQLKVNKAKPRGG